VAVFGVIAEASFSSISVSSWTSTSIHRYQRAYAGAKAERIKKPMKTEALGAGRAPLLRQFPLSSAKKSRSLRLLFCSLFICRDGVLADHPYSHN
jgi:hypothetical protein